MGNKKDRKDTDKKNTLKTGPGYSNDQLGENASGMDKLDEKYKKQQSKS